MEKWKKECINYNWFKENYKYIEYLYIRKKGNLQTKFN